MPRFEILPRMLYTMMDIRKGASYLEFSGIPMDAFAFLFELRLQNDKAFFEANRERFNKSVRDPLRALVSGLEPTLNAIDPLLITKPSSCVSRIYRDTRFSADKSPFRDHMWLAFRREEDKHLSDCFIYYFEISPERYSYGCGTYGPLPALMEKVRARAAAEEAHLVSIVNGLDKAGFSLLGEDFKRPKVKDAPPEALKIVNKKGFYASKESLSIKNTSDAALLNELKQGFCQLEPLYRFARGMPRQ